MHVLPTVVPLAFLLLATTASSQISIGSLSNLERVICPRFQWFHSQNDSQHTYGLIENFLCSILKSIEGKKEQYLDEVKIAENISFKKVNICSDVADTRLDMQERGTRYDIKELTVPIHELDVTGTYKFSNVALPGGVVLRGNGKFAIRLENLKIWLSLQFRRKLDSTWRVDNIRATTSLTNSSIRFDDLMDGEPVGEFLNEMINGIVRIVIDLLEGLVESNKDALKVVVAKLIEALMNYIVPPLGPLGLDRDSARQSATGGEL